MTVPIPAFLFRHDTITINRATAGADADGNPERSHTLLLQTRGTLGTPNALDVADAAQRLTQVDQVLAVALGIDIRDDDQIVCSRGTFTVVSVATRRLYQRALMRKKN